MRTNFHTHTYFSDGHNTPRQMIEEAIAEGLVAIGFSEHSYTPAQIGSCMPMSGAEPQFSEVRALGEEYRGIIAVYEGIELDSDSVLPPLEYDYVISSVHQMTRDGVTLALDNGVAEERRIIDEWFGGDFAGFAREYFETVVNHARNSASDIVGHFDVITKYSIFDETDKRYREYATDAVRELIKTNRTFEMNTGAIARKYRTTPYPADFIVDEIARGGGRILVTTDCHYRERLTSGMDVAEALLPLHGFIKNENADLNAKVRGIEIWEAK